MKVVKRSMTIAGHRTSVSLEEPFWEAFCDCAEARGLSLNALAQRIDAGRIEDGEAQGNVSSAIRVFVLEDLQARLKAIDTSGGSD